MQNKSKTVLFVLIPALAFVVGYWARGSGSVTKSAVRKPLYYHDPMHPSYRSDKPGIAPDCGMQLEPVYADTAADSNAAAAPGTLRISFEKQQMMGLRTDVVRRTSDAPVVRVPARVAVDDARLYRLIAPNDGWIRELGSNPAGTFVKKDEVLASYYVKDLASTQQSYLYAFDIFKQYEQAQNTNPLQRTTAGVNLRQALDALRSLGMSDVQIEELQKTHTAASELHMYSPVTGVVLARNLSPAGRFDKGTELYRIADLRHVWVLADIFEKDRAFVTPGTRATVRYRGREFTASLSNALPQFDPQSRTLKTRFELDNSSNLLWPEMFVDLEIHVNLPAAIAVPADAVIDSGRQKTVYVSCGDGCFEPRLVKTGWRMGDRVQVTEGLEPGEQIVIAGNFLIDSESRMRAPAVSMKDPVCGMAVASNGGHESVFEGTKYHFCSKDCKDKFDAGPARFALRNTAPAQPGGTQ